ncbi:MAG: 4'-phosphopantetheinyl transferase superfamily protein [Thermoleophilia bacterium]
MTTTTGIDLLDVADVREALRVFGARYVQHILTVREQSACTRRGVLRPELVAAAFAAKEAAIKTCGMDADSVNWLDVELTEEVSNRLNASFLRSASTSAGGRATATISISVARTDSVVLAIAIAQGHPRDNEATGEK